MKTDLFGKKIASTLLSAPEESMDPQLTDQLELELGNLDRGDRTFYNRSPDTCYIICCCTFFGASIITALALAVFGLKRALSD